MDRLSYIHPKNNISLGTGIWALQIIKEEHIYILQGHTWYHISLA